jgi:putative FmdB family regulatory protein
MPLYDYRCTACGQEVEVMHGINDSGPDSCESCGGTMRKSLSPPAIHFKGSGWAKKDAATASSKSSTTQAGSSAAASSDGKDAGKSKTAPGAAAEGTPADPASGAKTSSGSSSPSGGKTD